MFYVLNNIILRLTIFSMFLKKSVLCFILFVITVIFYSCEIINPDEEIPSYISIDKIVFKTNIDFDVNSNDISDAWVYIDDNLVGTFELPAKFPVLSDGLHKVVIRPGIKLNGIAGTRSIYPFYQKYDTTINLIKGKVVKLNVKTTYNSDVKFVWKENFENPNITLKKTPRSDTTIKMTANIAPYTFDFGGATLGIVNLTSAKPYFECITDTSYVLPKGNRPVFLELDYKTNNSFTVTIQILYISGINMQEYLTINPSDKWKKIYVNLTPVVNLMSNASGYKIFLHHRIDSQDANAERYILLDNIKLITGS